MLNKAFVIALVFLSGCVSLGEPLATLQARKPTQENFNQALGYEYQKYAESLADDHHPIRADHFARKGLAALAGEVVALENKRGFETNRAAFQSMLTDDVKDVAPGKAARAQILFDCWMENESICTESFAEAQSDLQFIVDALVHGGDNRYSVGFAPGSHALSSEANAMLDIVAGRVASYAEYSIELQLPGKRSKLSTARALAIEKALIDRQVNAGKIEVKPWGGAKAVALSTDRADPNVIVVQVESFVAPLAPAGH